MLAIIKSCAVFGMDSYEVRVEVDVSTGLPAFDIVGLPDASVRESKERVRTAIRNAGFEFPGKRITVNLAPADRRKVGAIFDLPIAVGILAATEQVNAEKMLSESCFVGELSLESMVRPIPGSLVMASCLPAHVTSFFVPSENSREAAIGSIHAGVYGIDSLGQVAAVLNGEKTLQPVSVNINEILMDEAQKGLPDMADVKGQSGAKRAMEIAAAGGHNLLFIGSPGSGKTMLARRMPSILPPFTQEESLYVTKIYSVAGLLSSEQGLLTQRPFRAPHHSASGASVIGGGRIPAPGEVSLATGGVLFLDEMPEFKREVLEALRQPLEDRMVTVSRVSGRADFPAGFQLIGAMNPCPCGHYGDPVKECSCTPHQIQKYFNRISGPLLDRIDLHVDVPRVQYQEISEQGSSETSAEIRKRVIAARNIQLARFAGEGITCNAQMERKHIVNYCVMTDIAEQILAEAFKVLGLSARGYDRILKVARTIADLGGAEMIDMEHIAEAIQYRRLDRKEM